MGGHLPGGVRRGSECLAATLDHPTAQKGNPIPLAGTLPKPTGQMLQELLGKMLLAMEVSGRERVINHKQEV